MEAELMYGLDQSSSSTSMNPAEDLHGLIAAAGLSRKNRNNTTAMMSSTMTSYNSANNDDEVEEEEDEQLLKARIASHPRYPSLLQAYIDCQKVGAPDEITSVLDDIMQTNNIGASNCTFRSDPELDKFMEIYCDVLVKYRSDLAKPLDEATTFLNNIETQLSDLCNSKSRSSRTISADDAVGSSEEEASGGENEMQPESSNFYKGENKDLKDKLLRKYSGYLGSLKQEFSKKKKKGKLPKEARQTLLEWWTSHYKWPYPTNIYTSVNNIYTGHLRHTKEADKIALAESTGLDQKQINNWFINQRKRHWKPSESMQFAVMGSLSAPFYED